MPDAPRRRIGDTGAPGGKILIVAGTREQARRRAEEMRLPPRSWLYAAGDHSLRGWTPGSIEYYGSFADRDDLWGLYEELRMVEARMAWAGREELR
jgi:hypothetical protein